MGEENNEHVSTNYSVVEVQYFLAQPLTHNYSDVLQDKGSKGIQFLDPSTYLQQYSLLKLCGNVK